MPINPQINDMPWFGKPADPLGSFQKGMNLAEQKQRMSQSRDMHPLRMADAKSMTSARDASTNLSKQSYQFNELSQDDRLSSVNSQARRNAVVANVAEQTQQAQVDMQNLLAQNKGRDWDARKGVDLALETQALSASAERVIVDQAVNAATKQAQIDQFNHRTSLMGHQATAAAHANKFTKLTEDNAIAAQNMRLQGMTDSASRQAQEHAAHLSLIHI